MKNKQIKEDILDAIVTCLPHKKLKNERILILEGILNLLSRTSPARVFSKANFEDVNHIFTKDAKGVSLLMFILDCDVMIPSMIGKDNYVDLILELEYIHRDVVGKLFTDDPAEFANEFMAHMSTDNMVALGSIDAGRDQHRAYLFIYLYGLYGNEQTFMELLEEAKHATTS